MVREQRVALLGNSNDTRCVALKQAGAFKARRLLTRITRVHPVSALPTRTHIS